MIFYDNCLMYQHISAFKIAPVLLRSYGMTMEGKKYSDIPTLRNIYNNLIFIPKKKPFT